MGYSSAGIRVRDSGYTSNVGYKLLASTDIPAKRNASLDSPILPVVVSHSPSLAGRAYLLPNKVFLSHFHHLGLSIKPFLHIKDDHLAPQVHCDFLKFSNSLIEWAIATTIAIIIVYRKEILVSRSTIGNFQA